MVQWTEGYRSGSEVTRRATGELAPVRLAARHTAMLAVWLGLCQLLGRPGGRAGWACC